MRRSTRLVSIRGKAMIIFEGPECISDDIIKYQDFWEWELFQKWKPHFTEALANNTSILDIGANIGNHTLQFKHFFPNNPIFAFELHHENFSLLKQNMSEYKDVKCFNVGVGSKTSMVHYNDGHISNSGVAKLDARGSNHNLVIALDDIKENEVFSNKIGLVKIDIEGHELPALEGMVNLLEKHKPMIWLEDITSSKLALNFLKAKEYSILLENKETHDFLMTKSVDHAL